MADRGPFADVLDGLAAHDELVHLERLPARAARTGATGRALPVGALERLGIPALWSHQAEAVELLRAGRSAVVATGTASGKSLCYQLPIAEAVASRGTALALYPTKALAQDQLRAFMAPRWPGLAAATYDGDSSPEAKGWVRRHANVVLTNPEMLHTGILPFHGRWASFFARLRFVVVDELHVLRGVFGSHLGHVLRRLRRIAARYGAHPTFVFSSATIGEPAALAAELCGLPVEAVTDDGSPRGERWFALWNPPMLDERTGTRGSANGETARLTAALVEHGWHTVAFCRSRRATEVVAADVRRRLPDGLADTVQPYRAGYLAIERRTIEQQLFSGALRAVIATNALELGIDVGGLDACVLSGFPGTIASMWQQAGRAGRSERPSLAVLVGGADQLDQWYLAHPRAVFTRPAEPAVVNLANPAIADPQVACAAYERPLQPTDAAWWPDGLVDDAVRRLVQDDRIRVRDGAAFWAGRAMPAARIGLRSGGGAEVRIAEADGRLVGTVDGGRALEVVHPGAIYLHLGQQYRVLDLDLDERVALVEAVDADEETHVRSELQVTILGTDRRAAVGRACAAVGDVEITTQVVGYERRDTRTRALLGREPLELPPTRLVTRAFWYTVDDAVLERARVDGGALPGALHAAEHAGIGILPLFTICDRWDVGGVSTALQADTGLPTIVIYDGYPGGIGIAELGFAAGRRHLEATRAVIERCGCRSGCPSCVQSPKCGNGNEPLEKGAALALLRAVLG